MKFTKYNTGIVIEDWPEDLKIGITGGGFDVEKNGDLEIVTLPTIYTMFNGEFVSEGDKIIKGQLVKKEN